MVKRICLGIMLFSCIGVARGQQAKTVSGSIAVPLSAEKAVDKVDLRLAQKPLTREDRGMKTGQELRQGTAVAAVRPLSADEERRMRVKVRIQQDRAKVKREVAISSLNP